MPPLPRNYCEPVQTRVQEELAISFRTQNRAFHRRQIAESQLNSNSGDPGDGLLMLRRVTHDAAFSHLSFAHFELGFDQNNQVGRGGEQGERAEAGSV